MRKILILISMIASAIGMKAVAASIDTNNNSVVEDLMKSGLSMREIQQLDLLSRVDPNSLEKAVKQDMRIKGSLKIEVMATANKGGGPCVHGGAE